MDLTHTKDPDVALDRSKEHFETFFDHSPTVSIVMDRDGTIRAINSHGAEQLGYHKSALVGEAVSHLVHPQDRTVIADQIDVTSATLGAVASRDLRLLHEDGSSVWVRASTRSMMDLDEQPIFLLACKDLTEHKESEARLLDYQARLRTLTLELQLAEEKERRRIAMGLHDDVGHSLALARMKLGAFESRRAPDGGGELAEVRELIDHAIQATRTLTFDLSSPILYELGLEAALESVGERMLDGAAIAFAFHSDGEPKPLSTDATVVLYRSVRELLLNVLKHARARSVRLVVRRIEDRIEIVITDDGVGFDLAMAGDCVGPGDGYGLLSVREQLHAIGGALDAQAAPGRGTKTLIVAPLASKE